MPPISPFYSIIIPTYNRAGLLTETIAGFTAQSFTDYELIIVDDGSTDNTPVIVKELAATNNKIKYFKKENGERGAARNYGIDKAKGQYISFIDSDDTAYPYALLTVYKRLITNTAIDCLATGYEIREKNSKQVLVPSLGLKKKSINQLLLTGNILSCIGVFIRHEILKKFRFSEEREFAGTEDWLLWLTLAARFEFVYEPTVCFCMWQHKDRSVMGFSEEALRYRAERLKAELMADDVFVKKYGRKSILRIYSHQLTYTALHLAMSKKKSRAFAYWFKALRTDSREIFTKRTLALFNKLLRYFFC